MTPDQLKVLLKSIPQDTVMVLGPLAFPVGSMSLYAMQYIERLETIATDQAHALAKSCRPIQMEPKP